MEGMEGLQCLQWLVWFVPAIATSRDLLSDLRDDSFGRLETIGDGWRRLETSGLVSSDFFMGDLVVQHGAWWQVWWETNHLEQTAPSEGSTSR